MNKVPFKAIEKYRYGLRKTLSKHLNKPHYYFGKLACYLGNVKLF